MSFGGFNDSKGGAPMADINVTPMVDVMLVLLVIFIMTAPLFTHAIKLDLPAAQSTPSMEKPETVTLSINGEGRLFWNNEPLSQAELEARMAAAAQQKPLPELQLRADKGTRYEIIAQVMSAAQNSGLTKMGFITDPKAVATAPQASR